MLFFNIKIFVNYVQLLYYTHELYMYVFTPENYTSEIINDLRKDLWVFLALEFVRVIHENHICLLL